MEKETASPQPEHPDPSSSHPAQQADSSRSAQHNEAQEHSDGGPQRPKTPRPHRHSIIGMGVSKFVKRVTRTLGFGLDIGGTLLKFVCFEPVDAYHHMEKEEAANVHFRIRRFLEGAIKYSQWDGADHLQYHCEALGGIFHFLKMPSTSMQGFVDLIADFEELLQHQNPSALPGSLPLPSMLNPSPTGSNLKVSIRHVPIVGLTGGGSSRFASIFQSRHLAFLKQDADRSSSPPKQESESSHPRPRFQSGQSQSHGSTTLVKYDEMDCLVQGVNFLVGNFPGECYIWNNAKDPKQILAAERHIALKDRGGDENIVASDERKSPPDKEASPPQTAQEESDIPVKQSLHLDQAPEAPYPYLLVNVGSGVSILRVDGESQLTRVGGSSVGGGTFLGLCRLFTGAQSFEEAIRLAICGKSTDVDMLVSDIYGGDYNELGLSGDTIACSFGKFGRINHPDEGNLEQRNEAVIPQCGPHMMHTQVPEGLFDEGGIRKDVRPEDLAASALLMVTINISSLVVLHAQVHNIDTVLFAGNFLAGNPVSQQLLTWAVNFWSNHTLSSLFLEHEGYFGAIGALLMSISDRQQQSSSETEEANEPLE